LDPETSLLAVVLVALLLLSGTFSGSETALFSLDRIRLRRFERSSSSRERLAAAVAARPERLLAGILFGNTLVNVATSSVAVALVARLGRVADPDALVAVAVFADTALVLALGEIVPKAIAVQWPAGVARPLIPALAPLLRLIGPGARLLEAVSARLLRVAGVTPAAAGGTSISRPELRVLFEDIRDTRGLSESEALMAANIFEFFETRAHEIMTPRVDVKAVAVDGDREALRRAVLEARHSRLPMYRGSLDHVVGFLNTKEFLLEPDRPLDTLIKPVHFVPERARVHGILRDVQAQGHTLVVVVNEYGGTSGIITSEDLVEEVVGEIFDEQEREEEPEIRPVGPGVWHVDGLMLLEELAEALGRDLPPGPAQTVAGHVAHVLGRPPRAGEKVRAGDLTFRVLQVIRHRARRLEVTVPEGESP